MSPPRSRAPRPRMAEVAELRETVARHEDLAGSSRELRDVARQESAAAELRHVVARQASAAAELREVVARHETDVAALRESGAAVAELREAVARQEAAAGQIAR